MGILILDINLSVTLRIFVCIGFFDACSGELFLGLKMD